MSKKKLGKAVLRAQLATLETQERAWSLRERTEAERLVEAKTRARIADERERALAKSTLAQERLMDLLKKPEPEPEPDGRDVAAAAGAQYLRDLFVHLHDKKRGGGATLDTALGAILQEIARLEHKSVPEVAAEYNVDVPK